MILPSPDRLPWTRTVFRVLAARSRRRRLKKRAPGSRRRSAGHLVIADVNVRRGIVSGHIVTPRLDRQNGAPH
jgi:hypothetical protein